MTALDLGIYSSFQRTCYLDPQEATTPFLVFFLKKGRRPLGHARVEQKRFGKMRDRAHRFGFSAFVSFMSPLRFKQYTTIFCVKILGMVTLCHFP